MPLAWTQRGYRDIEESCLTCSPVCQQKVSRVGVAMVSHEVIACFHLDAMFQPEHHEEFCVMPQHHPHVDGMMSKWAKGIVRAKCTLGSNLMDQWIKM